MISSNFTRVKLLSKGRNSTGNYILGSQRRQNNLFEPISRIKLKEPGIMVGYIQFIHTGNIERTKDLFFGKVE
jgi:hypothetical protein